MNQLEDRNLSPMQDTPPGFNGTGDYNNQEHGKVFTFYWKCLYSGVSLTRIPDNETLNLVIRYPDKIYPEF
jgi:hypothetical protein